VAQVVLAEWARGDLDRLFDFLAAEDPRAASDAIEDILDAFGVLERHPLIGRPIEEGLRALVISRGKSGYVALYDYYEASDTVLVLAVLHQREAGFPAA
jgi:plasmid stabilization system protein ParE